MLGAGWNSTVADAPGAADGPPPGTGQFLLALRPAAGFTDRIEPLLAAIAETEGARLPGARRSAARARAEAEGIAIPTIYLEQAQALIDGRP